MNLRFLGIFIAAATFAQHAFAQQMQFAGARMGQNWQPNQGSLNTYNQNFGQQQAMMQQQRVMVNVQQQPQYVMYGNQMVPVQQAPAQYMPANQVAMMPQAAGMTRITGQVPMVGRNAANVAGRQYYNPATYDRLAESGLYVGLGLGYSVSVMGGMTADFNDWLIPSAAESNGFMHEAAVMPLQISVGAAINTDVRVDFSYNRYSGLSYPSTVKARDAGGALFDVSAYDGAITSSSTMLNVYYNVDSYMGNLVGGSLRPYVGVGLGIATNTISDYIIHDPTWYPELSDDEFNNAGPGLLSGVADIFAYHSGGTTEGLSFMLEGGLTSTMESGMRVDFFLRYMNLGRVQSSGSVVVSQTEYLTDGYGQEYEADYASVFHYTGHTESGSLSTYDLGVRLRVQF
ncbi:MAG: hypothetical protein LBB23_03590 [Rickettsiales bacterium]|jgi:hypothetical protein|nr:hypothetical protein [Rickettsiales bacterium]